MTEVLVKVETELEFYLQGYLEELKEIIDEICRQKKIELNQAKVKNPLDIKAFKYDSAMIAGMKKRLLKYDPNKWCRNKWCRGLTTYESMSASALLHLWHQPRRARCRLRLFCIGQTSP